MFLINYDDTEYEINQVSDLEEISTEALLYTYNQLTGKSTKKFASRAKGIEQVWVLIGETDATPATASRATGAGGRSAPLDKNLVIRVLSESNPKTPNTKSHDRFKLYKDGMTIGKYLEAGGRRADLAWDAEKEFIKTEKAS